MPDFEALIRRQQEHQSTAAERLSLLQPTTTSQAVGAPIAWLAFAGGLVGSLLGTVGYHLALAQGWLRF